MAEVNSNVSNVVNSNVSNGGIAYSAVDQMVAAKEAAAVFGAHLTAYNADQSKEGDGLRKQN
jgi:hypothetical protein